MFYAIVTGDANLNLTIHKKSMMEQNSYLTNVLNTIKSKDKQMIELGKERDVIQVQADSLAQKLDDVRKVPSLFLLSILLLEEFF